VAVNVPTFGPADATFVVTMNPSISSPFLYVDGVPAPAPVTLPTDPVQQRDTFSLAPGAHTLKAVYHGSAYYLPSSSSELEVHVGTWTFLTLSTNPDGSVPVDEVAELKARLFGGADIPGGTLLIRDVTSGAIVASTSVSSQETILTGHVTRSVGSHPFATEFIPPDPSVQPATTPFTLVVVDGNRPDTIMDTWTLVTPSAHAVTSFSSPDPSATFECRYDNADGWYPCVSPHALQYGPGDTRVFHVRARAPNGLVDPTPASRTWIVRFFPPASTYVPVPPHRLLDSRFGNGLSGVFRSGVPRTVQVTNRHPGNTSLDIPDNAVAISGNLTVTGQSHAGWL
jgi:hypothetical protein